MMTTIMSAVEGVSHFKPEVYVCPRCCYSCTAAWDMVDHFAEPCEAADPSRDYELTDDVQDYILEFGEAPKYYSLRRFFLGFGDPPAAAAGAGSADTPGTPGDAGSPGSPEDTDSPGDAGSPDTTANAGSPEDEDSEEEIATISGDDDVWDRIQMEYDADALHEIPAPYKYKITWHWPAVDGGTATHEWAARLPYTPDIWKVAPRDRPRNVLYCWPKKEGAHTTVPSPIPKHVYECPRCLYRTQHKGHILDHFKRTEPCTAADPRHNFKITKAMREYILSQAQPASDFGSIELFLRMFSRPNNAMKRGFLL